MRGIQAASAIKAVQVTAKLEYTIRNAVAAEGRYPVLNDERGFQTAQTRAKVVTMFNVAQDAMIWNAPYRKTCNISCTLTIKIHKNYTKKDSFLGSFFQAAHNIFILLQAAPGPTPIDQRNIRVVSEASQIQQDWVDPDEWDWSDFSDPPEAKVLDDSIRAYDFMPAEDVDDLEGARLMCKGTSVLKT